MQQLTLDIQFNKECNFDNYFSSGNDALIAQLKSLSLESKDEMIFLWGEQGVGKTHLLQSVSQHLDKIPCLYLPLEHAELHPDMLSHLETMPFVILDNIDAVIGNESWEYALFNLFNVIKMNQGNLIISSDQTPKGLPVKLKDLTSRLTQMTVFKVHPLNDNNKQALMKKKALEYGLDLSEDIANYILRRHPRHISELISVIEKLDHASLIEKRRLTLPFVKQVLEL